MDGEVTFDLCAKLADSSIDLGLDAETGLFSRDADVIARALRTRLLKGE